MQLDVVVNDTPQRLHPMVRYECERIALEALANACRHSGAKAIKISLDYAPRDFILEVADDGTGIDEQTIQIGKQGHFGLLGKRGRAGRINAQLSIRNSGGTTITVSVPGRVAYA